MPTERRKKMKTPEELPGAGDPERKRVLNILAQRRYRRKQRERIAALEAQAKNQSPLQPVRQNGGVQAQEEFPGFASTVSSESPPDLPTEKTVLSSDDFGFLEMDFGQEVLDMSLLEDLNVCHLHSPSPVASRGQGSFSPASPLTFDPPLSSDAQLQVPILNVIRAFSSIATALDIVKVIWDPSYLHVLPPKPVHNLPWNLQPTPAQLAIPHHPFLDALPWPSIREKLICILSLPSMLRPPVAQNSDSYGTGQASAIQKLIHDLDDFQEGARVYGNVVGWSSCNELEEDAWEIGECFYRNWWFSIDPNVLATTNKRRLDRGVRALKLRE